MPRGTTPTVKPSKSLSSSAAREKLPELVHEARALKRPARSLAERAVEIGPYNKGGAWLVPEVDAQAAIQREDELRRQVEALTEQLENLEILRLVKDRLESERPNTRISGLDFVRELGFEDIAEEIEQSRR